MRLSLPFTMFMTCIIAHTDVWCTASSDLAINAVYPVYNVLSFNFQVVTVIKSSHAPTRNAFKRSGCVIKKTIVATGRTN